MQRGEKDVLTLQLSQREVASEGGSRIIFVHHTAVVFEVAVVLPEASHRTPALSLRSRGGEKPLGRLLQPLVAGI